MDDRSWTGKKGGKNRKKKKKPSQREEFKGDKGETSRDNYNTGKDSDKPKTKPDALHKLRRINFCPATRVDPVLEGICPRLQFPEMATALARPISFTDIGLNDQDQDGNSALLELDRGE